MDGWGERKKGRNSWSYLNEQKNQRGSSTPQGQCGRELHCGRAKEQPGHDLDNMSTTITKD